MIYRGGRSEMGTIPGGPLGKAKYALSIGRPDEAERICRKRLERSPDDTSAHIVLAQALLQQQRVDEAAEEARTAIRQQSSNVDAHLILASALIQRTGPLGRVPAEAERVARRAVNLQPKAAKTHVQLAEVLAAKREYAAARAEADEACRLEPRLAGAHLIRAIVLLSDKDPAGAVQASDAALRSDRTLTQAEFIKANAYMDLKRYDDALSALDTVEKQNPLMMAGNSQSLRGRIYFRQRKLRQSYRLFRDLQTMNPRLRVLAPVLAGINMVMVGLLAENAQYGWVGLLIVLAALLLFLIQLIPVVGGWIAAALVLGLVGFSAFAAVRQGTGRLFPADPTDRLTAIGATAVVLLGGGAIAFEIISSLSINVFHVAHGIWFTPPTLVLGGAIALALAAGAAYGWPLLMARFGGRSRTA